MNSFRFESAKITLPSGLEIDSGEGRLYCSFRLNKGGTRGTISFVKIFDNQISALSICSGEAFFECVIHDSQMATKFVATVRLPEIKIQTLPNNTRTIECSFEAISIPKLFALNKEQI